MTKDEALKMVINNLEIQDFNTVNATLIAYCKEALELSEKQHTFPDKKQPAQEPVAWIYEWEDEKAVKLTFHPDSKAKVIPLYTHPAPSWQGLSDDEIDSVWFEVVKENNFEGTGKYFARAIEKALKEKNT